MSGVKTQSQPTDDVVKDFPANQLDWQRPMLRRIDLTDSQSAGGVGADGGKEDIPS